MMDKREERGITIALPSYNSAKYLSGAIESFLSQEYPNKRLIIVDGKSEDGSHQIIKAYADRYSEIRWVRERDTGIAHAINLALDFVFPGDVWGYLGADDILLPNVLTKVADLFQSVPELNGVYFDSYSLSPSSCLQLRRCPDIPFSINALIRHGSLAGLQNIYFDAALVKSYRFVESTRIAMDYEFCLRLAKDGYTNVMHYPLPSTVNIIDGNLSSVYAAQANSEMISISVDLVGWTPLLLWRFVRHGFGNFRRSVSGYVKRPSSKKR